MFEFVTVMRLPDVTIEACPFTTAPPAGRLVDCANAGKVAIDNSEAPASANASRLGFNRRHRRWRKTAAPRVFWRVAGVGAGASVSPVGDQKV